MSTLQHDEAMIQALAITKAQAGVRSMSAEEIVTYINDLVRAIRSTLDKNTEDDGQAEEKSILKAWIPESPSGKIP